EDGGGLQRKDLHQSSTILHQPPRPVLLYGMTATRFELPPQYDPHAVERPLYERWLAAQAFTAHVESPKPPYVIVIPPPNVTAVLHMGQGLNNVTQDVLIRFERMRG